MLSRDPIFPARPLVEAGLVALLLRLPEYRPVDRGRPGAGGRVLREDLGGLKVIDPRLPSGERSVTRLLIGSDGAIWNQTATRSARRV